MEAIQISISPIFLFMNYMDLLFTRDESAFSTKETKVFSGLKYAIFNNNCSRIDQEKYEQNLNKTPFTLGVCMGGSDAPNITKKVLENIINMDYPLIIYIMLGEGYQHSYQDLVEISQKNKSHEIILTKTNRSMWEILSNCCLAILSGGITVVESAFAGLPSISLLENDEKLKKSPNKTIFKKGGSYPIVEDFNANFVKMTSYIEKCIHDKNLLITMRSRSMDLINKHASKKIYQKINEIRFNENIKLFSGNKLENF